MPNHENLPPGETAPDTRAAQEPSGADEAEHGHHGVGPQQGLEEVRGAVSGRILKQVSVRARHPRKRYRNIP